MPMMKQYSSHRGHLAKPGMCVPGCFVARSNRAAHRSVILFLLVVINWPRAHARQLGSPGHRPSLAKRQALASSAKGGCCEKLEVQCEPDKVLQASHHRISLPAPSMLHSCTCW